MTMPLSAFGWTSGQSAAAQTVALQSALDSGEPISLPIGTVVVDQPLVMEQCPSLVGYGADASGQALATSQIRCADPDMDILLVKRHHAYLAGFNVHGEGNRTTGPGRGIVIGEGCPDYLRGVVLERVTVNPFHRYGVHLVAAGGFSIDKSSLWGREAGVCIQNTIHADTGDGRITASDLNAGQDGAGLRWFSGGGLYIENGCKFNHGRHHIVMEWNEGGSGNFALMGCSLETCTNISVLLSGSYQFKRMQIVGNTWGINSVCLAVNFPLLEDVTITGNTFSSGAADPIIELYACQGALVSGNTINGHGVAGIGVRAFAGCVDGAIAGNKVRGCGLPAVSYSASTPVGVNY